MLINKNNNNIIVNSQRMLDDDEVQRGKRRTAIIITVKSRHRRTVCKTRLKKKTLTKFMHQITVIQKNCLWEITFFVSRFIYLVSLCW